MTGVEIFTAIPMVTEKKYIYSALSAVKKGLMDWVLGTFTSLDALEVSLSIVCQAVKEK